MAPTACTASKDKNWNPAKDNIPISMLTSTIYLDTLGKIASLYQVSIDVILSANPTIDRKSLTIYVGQELIIPQVIPDVVTSASP